MLSQDIKDMITNEYGAILSNVKQDIDLFEMVIDYPTTEPEIEGVKKAFNYALNWIFANEKVDQSGQFEMIAQCFFNVEPFLKKLIHMINPNYPWSFDTGSDIKPIALARVIKDLKLIPKDFDLKDESFPNTNNASLRYLAASYNLRNTSAHELRSWNLRDRFENIQNVMITYLTACEKHRPEIIKAFSIEEQRNILNANKHVNQIIKAYENNVHDGFRFVPIEWQINNTDTTMISFWKDIAPAKHVLLLGEAGCGKTTSINYLAYCDAKRWIANDRCAVPVVIKLIDIDNSWFSVEDSICSQLNISLEYCLKFLNQGQINVYLDGLNEMISSYEIKTNAAQQIEKFLKTYKNTKVVITDRIHETIKIDHDCISCTLKKIGSSEAKKFLKDSSSNIDESFLETAGEYVDRLSNIQFTPILLKFIKDYYEQKKELPDNSSQLVYEYFKSLMDREIKEKKDINADSKRLIPLIEYLALQDSDDDGWTSAQILRHFKKCADQLGIVNIDAEASLNLVVQMGIISENQDTYRFSNTAYQDCFIGAADLDVVFDWV